MPAELNLPDVTNRRERPTSGQVSGFLCSVHLRCTLRFWSRFTRELEWCWPSELSRCPPHVPGPTPSANRWPEPDPTSLSLVDTIAYSFGRSRWKFVGQASGHDLGLRFRINPLRIGSGLDDAINVLTDAPIGGDAPIAYAKSGTETGWLPVRRRTGEPRYEAWASGTGAPGEVQRATRRKVGGAGRAVLRQYHDHRRRRAPVDRYLRQGAP